jgi:hypothetical protein
VIFVELKRLNLIENDIGLSYKSQDLIRLLYYNNSIEFPQMPHHTLLCPQKAMFALLVSCVLLAVSCQAVDRDPGSEFLYGTFPKDFMWGTSVAAGQVEGGANQDGQWRWDNYNDNSIDS